MGKAVDFDFFEAILDIELGVTENMVLVGTVNWEDNIEVDSILFLLFIVDALVCDLRHGIFFGTRTSEASEPTCETKPYDLLILEGKTCIDISLNGMKT